jgi:4,5-dihydroxyphthalate decarboxylase
MNGLSRRHFLKTAGSIAGASIVGASCAATRQEPDALPKITLTAADYLRYTPLATGELRPKDLDLTWVRGPRSDMLRRALSDPEVSGGETSMLGHLLRVDRGDRSHVAIPVFLLRNFTVRDIYTLKNSSLTPDKLSGSRIGIYNWTASGAIWYRHLVRYFGQDPAAIKWVVGGTDQPARVQSRVPLPNYVTDAPPDKSLTDLLLASELDAIFVPLPPKTYHPVEGPIVRLIPDFRAVERRYFEETRCYPPQHVLVLRREMWERDPSIGRRLLETFQQCETKFQEGLHLFPYSTPWQVAEVEETDLLMGSDFHAHGLDKNHHEVDVFCQGGFDDGQTKRRVTVEEFFSEFLLTV